MVGMYRFHWIVLRNKNNIFFKKFYVHLKHKIATLRSLFDNTENAFSLKSDSELERAYFLFKLIANQPLVRIGTAVTNFALKAKLPVEGLIRATVFDHFCGGTSESDCLAVIDKMYSKGVSSVLDYSVEGAEDEQIYDQCFDRVCSLLEFVKVKKSIPFAVFKPTGYGRLSLYEKVSVKQPLNELEKEEWYRVVQRFQKTCKLANELGVMLLIDAEESWIQPAVDELVEQMMERFNKKRTLIFNTFQMYRWDRLSYMKHALDRAMSKGYFVGVKLVRGAYLEKENERALEKGYRSPICSSKNETDANYNAGIDFCMQHLNRMDIFVGTHNEESTQYILQKMADQNLSKNDPRIWFGQLYGMSDHISYNLSSMGYQVAKYLPFGPVKDVMPYLIRRAEENTSVAGQTNRELELIQAERKRRKIY